MHETAEKQLMHVMRQRQTLHDRILTFIVLAIVGFAIAASLTNAWRSFHKPSPPKFTTYYEALTLPRQIPTFQPMANDAKPFLLEHQEFAKELVMRSFLKGAIFFAEGMYPNAYNVYPYDALVGYTTLQEIGKDYSDHPRHDVWIQSIGTTSDAAGACQFLSTTWDSLHDLYPNVWFTDLPAFHPKNQDLACLINFMRTGGLEKLLGGWGVNEDGHIWVNVDAFSQAVYDACGQWISFPCSSGQNADPRQPVKRIEDIWQNFLATLEEFQAAFVPMSPLAAAEAAIVPKEQKLGDFPAPFKAPLHCDIDKDDSPVNCETIAGYPVTDIRRWRKKHPIYGDSRPHDGFDIGMDVGVPIIAPLPGRNDCPKGREGAVSEFYPDDLPGQMFRFVHVDVCESGKYKPGDVFAKSGNRGGSTGPHLHMEGYSLLNDSWNVVDYPKGWTWAFIKGRMPTATDKPET